MTYLQFPSSLPHLARAWRLVQGHPVKSSHRSYQHETQCVFSGFRWKETPIIELRRHLQLNHHSPCRQFKDDHALVFCKETTKKFTAVFVHLITDDRSTGTNWVRQAWRYLVVAPNNCFLGTTNRYRTNTEPVDTVTEQLRFPQFWAEVKATSHTYRSSSL